MCTLMLSCKYSTQPTYNIQEKFVRFSIDIFSFSKTYVEESGAENKTAVLKLWN